MSNLILIDTSFLYALYNARDENHKQAVQYALEIEDKSIIPEIILAEISFLFLRDIGHYAIAPFLEKLVASGVRLQCLEWFDIQRAQQILVTFASSEFDLADACIMALAERLEITRICTFDRRDFSPDAL
jgi:hypothetical protein